MPERRQRDCDAAGAAAQVEDAARHRAILSHEGQIDL
jgi:hypothetical protein